MTWLEINDYKVSARDEDRDDRQLLVYVVAGRRGGLDVRGANVYDLKAKKKRPESVGGDEITSSEQQIEDAGFGMRTRAYPPRPDASRCGRCDVRMICPHRDDPA